MATGIKLSIFGLSIPAAICADESKYLNNEFAEIYLVRRDSDPAILKLQPEEVSECFFLPYQEFKAMATRRDPDLVAHPDEETLLFQKLDPEFDDLARG